MLYAALYRLTVGALSIWLGFRLFSNAGSKEADSSASARIARGTLAGIRKTAMILVGQALSDEKATASRLYDEGFSHGYRQGR